MPNETNYSQEKISEKEKQFMDISIAEMLENELLQLILCVVQDGICFLSADMDVLYNNPAMRFWFHTDRETLGRKCYEAYHSRKEPCTECPALEVIRTGKPAAHELAYRDGGRHLKWHSVFCAPVLDDSGNVIMIIEYVHDTTDERKKSLSLELMQTQLHEVMEMAELREEERKQRDRHTMDALNRSIGSVLKYLEKILDPGSYDIVRRQIGLPLQNIQQRTGPSIALSPQEKAVASYIAEGLVSKEIADAMQISKKTVDYHRTNLRKKLGLKVSDNLQTAIQELFAENGW